MLIYILILTKHLHNVAPQHLRQYCQHMLRGDNQARDQVQHAITHVS